MWAGGDPLSIDGTRRKSSMTFRPITGFASIAEGCGIDAGKSEKEKLEVCTNFKNITALIV